MGIEKLAGRLPRKKVDYLKVRRTKGAAIVVRIDAAGALWLCAYRSKETYAFGDFFAAWARWQRLLQQWKMVDFKGELVFDGKDSPHKKPERERRDAKQQAARERIAAAKEEGKDPLSRTRQKPSTKRGRGRASQRSCSTTPSPERRAGSARSSRQSRGRR